ncbi:MAG TPA: hypothetical protein VES02_15275 [Dermatophilaceae bacterium]|nr:hypothetical protein [Dermatophilaceae bacterium]
MNNRPRLKSHAQPLRRGPGSLQLGLSPDTAMVLDGLSNAEIAMTEGLDGSMDIPTLYAVATAAGVAGDRLSSLIATLDEHHLLLETTTDRAWLSRIDQPRRHPLRPDATAVAIAAAYDLPGDGVDYVASRSTQHVVIGGEGDLPYALADLLRVGGIGQVSVGTNAVNTLDLELRGHQGSGRRSTFGSVPELPARPDLVVLTAMGAIHPDAGEPWLRRGIPHLPLVAQVHRVHVGPLITRDKGPCLTCMDLHRRDRDAAWPVVLAQLAPAWPLHPAAPVHLESALTAMTIGAAAMIVHACLDGQPVPGGLSLELSLPWPVVLCRRWFRHPLCGCAPEHATMAG